MRGANEEVPGGRAGADALLSPGKHPGGRKPVIWRANEREALKRALLMFGLGRSEKVLECWGAGVGFRKFRVFGVQSDFWATISGSSLGFP